MLSFFVNATGFDANAQTRFLADQRTRQVDIPLPQRKDPPARGAVQDYRTVRPTTPRPTPTAPPEPEGWTSGERIARLQLCVEQLATVRAEVEIADPIREGRCGEAALVRVKSISTPETVTFQPPVLVNCAMVPAIHDWLADTVQPASLRLLGSPVVRIPRAGGYSCRSRSDRARGRMSEHSLANAIDIHVFVTRDRQTISLKSDWGPTERDLERERIAKLEAEKRDKIKKADPKAAKAIKPRPAVRAPAPSRVTNRPGQKRGRVAKQAQADAGQTDSKPARYRQFLRVLHEGACRRFGTVLGPEANDAHRDHFHLDLAERRRGNYCR